LGRINILCGKNNSGKTSILEAITIQKSLGFGLTIEHVAFLGSLFESEAHRYSGPRPQDSIAWFNKYISKLIDENTIWYFDKKDEIVSKFQENFRTDKIIGRHDPKIFKYIHLIDQFFRNEFDNHRPILIPPKRYLESIINIKFDQKIEPNGVGLLNRLFYLKNQDLASLEFKTYKQIYDAFYEITEHHFNIIPDQSNNVTLYFRRNKRDWIKSDACGLGLSDVLIILTFSTDFDYAPILLEEPESHLHPDMQRRLLYFLRKNIDKQFFMTTHSNVFLDNAIIDKVYFTSFKESVEVNDYTSRAAILDDLGYSITDNLVTDLIILVEGPKDIRVIEEYLIKMGLYDRYDIKIWPLGGDIMDQLDLSVFAQNYSIIGLVDNDPVSHKVRERFIENCKKYKIEVVRLIQYAIENYFTLKALKEIFGKQISDGVTQIDPDKNLKDQIGINVKNNNRKLAQAISMEEIEGTDLYDFLLKVKKICEEKTKGPASTSN
jgi:predicted ATP-dependent endonuclease of OLD family